MGPSRGSKFLILLYFLMGCGDAGRLQAAGKIAPGLWKEAATASRLRVFVVLREQPQREIIQRIEAGSQLRMEKAEADYRQ
jgi:hypothetical protein